jgi:hypothetical protein
MKVTLICGNENRAAISLSRGGKIFLLAGQIYKNNNTAGHNNLKAKKYFLKVLKYFFKVCYRDC